LLTDAWAADPCTAHQTASTLTDLVPETQSVETKIKIVAILSIVTATVTGTETGAGLTRTETARTNASIETTTSTERGGTEKEMVATIGTEIATVRLEIIAVNGMAIAAERILMTVVKRGDARIQTMLCLMESVERRTTRALRAKQGVRGGTVRGILTGGDVTGTDTATRDVKALKVEIEDLGKYIELTSVTNDTEHHSLAALLLLMSRHRIRSLKSKETQSNVLCSFLNSPRA
jgi:hypothetical protein